MNEFRIVQTQPLTAVLPYQVEERSRAWYLPWFVWRPLQERVFIGHRYRMAPRRFQTPQQAQDFAESLLALRLSKQAEQEQLREVQRQQQQLPRVVQVLSLATPA